MAHLCKRGGAELVHEGGGSLKRVVSAFFALDVVDQVVHDLAVVPICEQAARERTAQGRHEPLAHGTDGLRGAARASGAERFDERLATLRVARVHLHNPPLPWLAVNRKKDSQLQVKASAQALVVVF